MTVRRYEISIVIGPCSLSVAEAATQSAHEAAAAWSTTYAATSLNFWDEDAEQPGLPVPGVDVVG